MACTEDAAQPMGETLDELAHDIEYFKQALNAPVLTMADIPESNNTLLEEVDKESKAGLSKPL